MMQDADGRLEDYFAQRERTEVWKVQPSKGQPRRGADRCVAFQGKFREGVPRLGKDQAMEKGAPEVHPAISGRILNAVVGHGQPEASQVLQYAQKWGIFEAVRPVRTVFHRERDVSLDGIRMLKLSARTLRVVAWRARRLWVSESICYPPAGMNVNLIVSSRGNW